MATPRKIAAEKKASKLTYPDPTRGKIPETKTADAPAPGSAAFNEAQTAVTGHPGVPTAYTDEGLKAANEGKLLPTPGLKLIQDEWYGQLEDGNPFQETGKPYADANPDKHFRFLGDAMVKNRGKRGYQVVNDPQTGKPVVVAGMTLAFIPMAVKEEKERRQAEKTNAMRRKSREDYNEEAKRIQQETGGSFQAVAGEITETRGHRRVAI